MNSDALQVLFYHLGGEIVPQKAMVPKILMWFCEYFWRLYQLWQVLFTSRCAITHASSRNSTTLLIENVHMSDHTHVPRAHKHNVYQAALQESPSLSAPVLSIWERKCSYSTPVASWKCDSVEKVISTSAWSLQEPDTDLLTLTIGSGKRRGRGSGCFWRSKWIIFHKLSFASQHTSGFENHHDI